MGRVFRFRHVVGRHADVSALEGSQVSVLQKGVWHDTRTLTLAVVAVVSQKLEPDKHGAGSDDPRARPDQHACSPA